MIKNLVHDPIFLAGKSEPATKKRFIRRTGSARHADCAHGKYNTMRSNVKPVYDFQKIAKVYYLATVEGN